MHRLIAAGLLLAAFEARLPAAAAEATSLSYQQDVAHDGATKFEGGFHGPLKLLWKRKFAPGLGIQTTSYPIIINDTAYVTADYDQSGTDLFALDIGTGDTRWSVHIASTDPFSGAAYDNGRLFVIDANGLLQAFAADTGALLWQRQFTGLVPQFSSPPIAQNGLVYLNGYGDEGRFYAVDETTGDIAWWRYVADFGGDRSIPTFAENAVLASLPCNYYKLDPASGKSIWERHLHCIGGGGKTASYFEKQYFIRNYNGVDNLILRSTDGHGGTFPVTYTPLAFWKGPKGKRLAFYNDTNFVYAIDVKTRKPVWTFRQDEHMQIAPIVINDVVVAASLLGNLYLLDAQTGRIKWSGSTGSPINGQDEQNFDVLSGFGAGDNVLLVPTQDYLMAYVQDKGPASAALKLR